MKEKNADRWVYLARVERDLTGGVTLYLIEDQTTVHLVDGAEYASVNLNFDPFSKGK